MPEQLTSANFSFLAAHDAQLVRLGALAERYFKGDPTTSLIKLRQYGETLAQLVAAKAGLFGDPQEPQTDLLRRLKFDRVVPREVGELFHHLRLVGNKATHEHQGTHAEALTALKVGRELGIWFHRTFGAAKTFSPGAFVPPRDPSAATEALKDELSRLKAELDRERSTAEKARIAAEEIERARLTAEERARKEREDRGVWEQIAAEAEQAKATLAAQLQSLQAAAVQAPAQVSADIVARADAAAAEINIDEASTRALIDERLRARGWEADTQKLRHGTGTRPAKGRNLAIAEWPTKSGPADYALFIGTCCIGVLHWSGRGETPQQKRVIPHRPGRALRADLPVRGWSRGHRRSVAGCRR
jgi:type I restriction enzyme R subunit